MPVGCALHIVHRVQSKNKEVWCCVEAVVPHTIYAYIIFFSLSLSLSLSNSKGIAGILGRVNRGLCLLFLVCSVVRESGVALSSSAMLSSGVVQNNGVVIVRNGGCVL